MFDLANYFVPGGTVLYDTACDNGCKIAPFLSLANSYIRMKHLY